MLVCVNPVEKQKRIEVAGGKVQTYERKSGIFEDHV